MKKKSMLFSFKCQMKHLNRCLTFRAGYNILINFCYAWFLKNTFDCFSTQSNGAFGCFRFAPSDRCSEENWMHWWRPCCSNERSCCLWDEFWGGTDMYGVLVWEPNGWTGTRRSSGDNVRFCVPTEEYVWTVSHTQARWS